MDAGTTRTRRGSAWFWIARYAPAEIACLVTMLVASIAAASVTDSPALLAIAAIAGATVGFYGVLIVQVMREQLRLLGSEPHRWRRAAARTLPLLVAEFGVAEILDTFFLRPALMMLGVVVIGDAVWGLLAGKVIADVLFYVISAVCFRVTERTGVRMPRLRLVPRAQSTDAPAVAEAAPAVSAASLAAVTSIAPPAPVVSGASVRGIGGEELR